MTDREECFYNLCMLLLMCPITEVQVITLIRRSFCGLTLRQIAKDHGCTFEAVRQQECTALEKINKFYRLRNKLKKIYYDI